MLHKMKIKPFRRSFSLTRESVAAEDRTVTFSFSSDEYIDHWWGWVKLEHTKDAVDFSRMNDGAPLLFQHNAHVPIGVVEKAWIDGNKGMCTVRFSKNAKAEEVFQDVADGIMRNVSVGFQILKLTHENPHDDKNEARYTATRWIPYEVSIVSIPADTSVGIGRAREDGKEYEIEVERQGGIKMDKDEEDTVKAGARGAQSPADSVNVQDAVMAERQRVSEITALARQFKGKIPADFERQFLDNGGSLDVFRAAVLEHMGKRAPEPVNTSPEIGMSDKETRSFSIVRMLNALANPANSGAQRAAAFEFECSDAVAQQLKRDAQGGFIPFDVLKRDLVVGTPAAGGDLVATNLLSGSFIDLLRPRMPLMSMGMQTLTGLVGDVAIPKQTGGATAYWVDESEDVTESTQAITQVGLTPKTVGAFTEYSRKLLLQSSIGVEQFVVNDLTKVLALALMNAIINGTGSGDKMPLGVRKVSGVNTVIGGDNGAAPTWAHIVQMWAAVAADNADVGSLGFLTNSKVIGKLMTVEKATNTAKFIVENFPDANGFTTLAGAKCAVSNQVPGNLTKGSASGVCSSLVYGNWNDVLIGLWGTLDVMVNPYANDKSGGVRVVALQDADVAVRNAESFCIFDDVLTA